MNVQEAIEIVMKDKEKGIFSTDLAEETDKRHSNVTRDIKNFITRHPEYKHDFIPCFYADKYGRSKPRYYLTAKAKEVMLNKYKFGGQASRLELSFEQILKGVITSEPVITQMSVLNYRVDFYIPLAHIIVEYDENHHKYQEHEDEIRMVSIRREIMRKIVEGEPLYEGDNPEAAPWLKGKDILHVIRVKQGEELDGLRRILYTSENDGVSILHLIA